MVGGEFVAVVLDKLLLDLPVVNLGSILRVHVASDPSKIVPHTPGRQGFMLVFVAKYLEV